MSNKDKPNLPPELIKLFAEAQKRAEERATKETKPKLSIEAYAKKAVRDLLVKLGIEPNKDD